MTVLSASAQTAQFANVQSPIYSATTLKNPIGSFTVDQLGNVYVADAGAVLKETALPDGSFTESVITTAFSAPQLFGVDRNGNVYLFDTASNRVVKEAFSAGKYMPSTLANIPPQAGAANPPYFAVDLNGNIYIAESSNSSRPTGQVVMLAAGSYRQSVIGSFYTGGGILGAVAVDAGGNVYVITNDDTYIVKLTPSASGYTHTMLPSYVNYPGGLAVDAGGNVYSNPSGVPGHEMVKFTPANGYAESVVPMSASYESSIPGPGGQLATDGSGNLYVNQGNAIYRIFFIGSGSFIPVNAGSTSALPVFALFTLFDGNTGSGHTVVTQGVPAYDFADSTTGAPPNCGNKIIDLGFCAVVVNFTPKTAGAQYGSAELLDNNGSVLAAAYVQGTGIAPQVSFLPGTRTIAATGLNSPYGVAVDVGGNLYIADTENRRVLKEAANSSSWTTIGSNFSYPGGVAVDGAGNVYVADAGNGAIIKETLAAGKYSQSTVVSGLSFPMALAVDGSGNIFVADTADRQVLKETLTAGAYTQTTVADGLDQPCGVAVDGSGNVYVVDIGSNRVYRETPSAGKYTQTRIGFGITSPAGVAVDGAGNVYISDYARSLLFRETVSGNSYIQTTIARRLSSPAPVAVDANGNAYVGMIGGGTVEKENFADAPALRFEETVINKVSEPQSVSLENIGNAPLLFPAPSTGMNPGISTGFNLNENVPSACPVVGATMDTATLAAENACVFSVQFRPETAGEILGSLTLTDNNTNAAGPGYTMQKISLSGIGKK